MSTGRVNLTSLRQYVDQTLTTTGTLGTIERVMDPITLEYVDTLVPVWTGRLLAYPRDLAFESVVVGEAEFTISRYVVLLPEDAPVEIGHRLVFTDSPDAPELTELAFTIVDAPVSAWGVARQCVAEVVTP